MIKKLENFNLEQIAKSGQCFRLKKINDTEYFVPSGNKYLIVSDKFDFSCSENEWNEYWYSYFDEDTDYTKIKNDIYKYGDQHLIESFEFGSGIRILKQDLWEIIFSFMVSQNNNISRISKSIELFCEKSGFKFEGSDYYRFPNADEVDLKIFDDASLGFGYRAPYLKEICEYVSLNPDWLDSLKQMSYDDAMKSLMERKGIGAKVANCICLFGLHKVDAFPIDTHVKQLLEKYYPNGFDFNRFGDVAGIVQQYLFYYELCNK